MVSFGKGAKSPYDEYQVPNKANVSFFSFALGLISSSRFAAVYMVQDSAR